MHFKFQKSKHHERSWVNHLYILHYEVIPTFAFDVLCHIMKPRWNCCSTRYLKKIGYKPVNDNVGRLAIETSIMLICSSSKLENAACIRHCWLIHEWNKTPNSPFMKYISLLQIHLFEHFIRCLTHTYEVHVVPLMWGGIGMGKITRSAL